MNDELIKNVELVFCHLLDQFDNYASSVHGLVHPLYNFDGLAAANLDHDTAIRAFL